MDMTMVTRSDDVEVPPGAHWAVINTVTPAGGNAHSGRTMRTLVAVRGLPYVHVEIADPLADDCPVLIEWLFESDQVDQNPGGE
jgi:hypothetical protein